MINTLNIISNNTNDMHLYFFIARITGHIYIYLLRCVSILLQQCYKLIAMSLPLFVPFCENDPCTIK